MKAVRLGLVGAGYWGEQLARVFSRLECAQLQIVCDPDPARRCAVAARDAPVGAMSELLERTDIEALVIATPPSTHYALARAALGAGKHCWVEKPLALRATEARELVELARQRGVVLFVDETFLYDPLLQQAKAWIDAGRLGRLRHLSFERLGMGRIRRDSNVWWNSAPHDLSILHYLVPGRVQHIHVDLFAHLQPEVADIAVGTIRMASGVSAHLHVSWLSPLKVASTVVIGERAMLHYEGRFGQRQLECFDYQVGDPAAPSGTVVPIIRFAAVESIRGGSEEPLGLAAEAFLRSIETGLPAPSAGEHSLRVVELLEAGAPIV